MSGRVSAARTPAARLVNESKVVDARVVGESSLAVLSADRLKILRLLAAEAMYPARVARELNEQVQAVYYHIRLLEREGFIKLVEYEERGGAVAKKYCATGNAFAVVLNEKAFRPLPASLKSKPPAFFQPLISGGHFDGRFILGSPDPHGPFRARGSELCASEVAALLGNYATFDYPLYFLDTELNEKIRRENLVLMGGPKVNTLVAEINSSLPIRFEEKTFNTFSMLSSKRYAENTGVIELVENPFNRTKKILLIGGLNHIGTRAAVLALVRSQKKVEEGNEYNHEFIAKVVEGFDEDGDGIVDAVEILE